MSHVLDLTNRAWTRDVCGGLTLIGTWILSEGRQRPCMVIMRTGEELNDHTVPCVVRMDQGWIWSEHVGDPRRAARLAFQFAQALRMNVHDSKNIIMLGTLIQDHLDDLYHIPPYTPARDPVAVGEVSMTDSRGRTVEKEIVDV